MTPEADAHLRKAQSELDDAGRMVAIGLARASARAAYYAAFHAAEAYIVEQTGKIAKTHSGVRSEFARLLKLAGNTDRSLTTILARAYKFKEAGDYGVGPEAFVTIGEAEDIIFSARRVVAEVAALLSDAPSKPAWSV